MIHEFKMKGLFFHDTGIKIHNFIRKYAETIGIMLTMDIHQGDKYEYQNLNDRIPV